MSRSYDYQLILVVWLVLYVLTWVGADDRSGKALKQVSDGREGVVTIASLLIHYNRSSLGRDRSPMIGEWGFLSLTESCQSNVQIYDLAHLTSTMVGMERDASDMSVRVGIFDVSQQSFIPFLCGFRVLHVFYSDLYYNWLRNRPFFYLDNSINEVNVPVRLPKCFSSAFLFCWFNLKEVTL